MIAMIMDIPNHVALEVEMYVRDEWEDLEVDVLHDSFVLPSGTNSL